MFGRIGSLFFFLMMMTGCGVQAIPRAKNNVEAAMAEVDNQYKRRADLVPNLVQVVKGYAKHESDTLTAVTQARAKASSMNLDANKLDPENLRRFQEAQGELGQALGRLMVVVEKYPDLKADQRFRELQAQLEGTENRIAVARNRTIGAVRAFNDLLTVPPTSWTNGIVYHYEKMPQWAVTAAEQKANEQPPQVEF